MPLNIKLEEFEGPLDLLLHLIRKSEVDIYDIPISEITDQYIAYLKSMQELDLNIASEFILMAATLLEIKSRMLVPGNKNKDDSEVQDEDPRKELIEKLVEYKKYKEFAEQLKEIDDGYTIYFKPPEIIDDIDDEEYFFKNITIDNLMHAFNKVVKTYQNKFNRNSEIPKNIDFDEFKVEDKMAYIKNLLNITSRINFEYFFENSASKLEIVVTFLALLELIRLKVIKVLQNGSFEDIVIERLREEEEWKIS